MTEDLKNIRNSNKAHRLESLSQGTAGGRMRCGMSAPLDIPSSDYRGGQFTTHDKIPSGLCLAKVQGTPESPFGTDSMAKAVPGQRGAI